MADLRAEVRPAAAEHGGKSPGTRNRSQAAPSPRQSPKLHSDSHRELPPGWERLHSERGIYYWNKRDGKTTWKFPEDEGTWTLHFPCALVLGQQKALLYVCCQILPTVYILGQEVVFRDLKHRTHIHTHMYMYA